MKPKYFVIVCLLLAAGRATHAQNAAQSTDPNKPAEKKLQPDPPGMTRLMPDVDAWVDTKHKRVVIDGTVCLRQGQLEMFACIERTKEHESIVAVPVRAFTVHAALLLVGAQPGSPVQFQPAYKPPTGTEIEITVIWKDEKGVEQRKRAQELIKNVKTGKAMDLSWVFAGSRFYEDPTTGKKHYTAEGGDFICVSNFPSAMLDVPAKSTMSGSELLFEAFTERIPKLGTKVRLVLEPKLPKASVKQPPATSDKT